MSVNQRFSNLKLNGYRIRAPTMGSLLVGGVSVGGGGGSGVLSETQYTTGNRLALFNGTDGNTIIDTRIYHESQEDGGAILKDQTDSHYILLSSQSVKLETDSGLGVELINNQNDINIYGNILFDDGQLKMNGGNINTNSGHINLDGGNINMGDGRILQLNQPVEDGEVANKSYVDVKTQYQTTTTLTASDIQNLHVYPGKTLVNAINGKTIFVDSLEFLRTTQGSTYTATGVDLYINYNGNYVDPSQTYTWKIPADGAQMGGQTLLTTTNQIRSVSYNTANYQPVKDNSDILLNATSAITGTGGNLVVRTSYRLVNTLV
jgi:hypothetical protein